MKQKQKWVFLYRNTTTSNINSLKGVFPGHGCSTSQGLHPHSPLVYISINFQTPAGGIDYSILEIPSSEMCWSGPCGSIKSGKRSMCGVLHGPIFMQRL